MPFVWLGWGKNPRFRVQEADPLQLYLYGAYGKCEKKKNCITNKKLK